MSEDIGVGVCYFLTISLSQDYHVSEAMLQLVRKKFSNCLYSVTEKGQNGKYHFHCIGRMGCRPDNLKRSIKNILRKEGLEVDDRYSIELLPEPNMFWRLGYLLKDKESKSHQNDYTDNQLRDAAAHYLTKPKRERQEKRGSTMSIRQLAEACIEANCYTEQEVKEFLRHKKRDGSLPYDVYKKLGVKSFIAYVTEVFDC